MTVDVIVNPMHPDALHACQRVQGICARAGVTATVRMTSIARPHGDPDSHARLTVVIGGDGTLREVAGMLLQSHLWHGKILVVPTGTASLFALNIGVHTSATGIDLLTAYLGISAPRADREDGARRWALIRSDVGWATIRRTGGRPTSALPFLVTAGIGHSGATLLHTPAWAKALFGAAGYGVGAVGRLGAAPLSVGLRMGAGVGDEETTELIWAVEFGNIARIPYGITVFPHGGVQTGTLAGLRVAFAESREDAMCLGSWWRRTKEWGRVFRVGMTGGHSHVDELRLWTAKSAHVVATDKPLPAHLDGESVGMVTGIFVRSEPAVLPMVVPAAATWST